MGDLSEHFSTSEMQCHCCGRCSIDGKLIDALESLRALGSEPIVINDAYRCEEQNKKVGGVPHSEHPLGMAADIRIVGLTVKQMFERAELVGAFNNGGLGVYDTGFIHVDVRAGKKARWARVKGKYLGIEESGLLK